MPLQNRTIGWVYKTLFANSVTNSENNTASETESVFVESHDSQSTKKKLYS